MDRWADETVGDELHRQPEPRTVREFAQTATDDSLRNVDLHSRTRLNQFWHCKPEPIYEEDKRSKTIVAALARQIFAATKQLRLEVVHDPNAEAAARRVASICLGLSAMMVLVLSELTGDPQLAAYSRVQL